MLPNGKPELLIPASSLEVLKVAVIYGADAVYIGGDMYGLRAKAKNFSAEDMKEGVDFAHEHGKRVFVTANITAHNKDMDGIRRYFGELKEIGPDALIISDPGVFDIAREVCPEIEIHISTQSNNVNYGTYLFWQRMGAKRVVSARELSIKEIKDIRAHIPDDLEIETFVHGAMCISYSGRCLLSNYFTGRDANLGACTHPCRWKYYIMEENRPGEYLPVEENERGTYIFNSKDLCMIEHIPDLVDAGIDSFKIEGRMRRHFMWRMWREHIVRQSMIISPHRSYMSPARTITWMRSQSVPIVSIRQDSSMANRPMRDRSTITIPTFVSTHILALSAESQRTATQCWSSATSSVWAMRLRL